MHWKSLLGLLKRLQRTPNKNDCVTIVGKRVQDSDCTSITCSTKNSEQISTETIAEPQVQRALVVAQKGKYEVRDDFPMPVVADGEIMIRCDFAGLNPIDWKSVDYNFCLPEFPWVTGREMSGTIEQIGSDSADFKIGDKVWTSTYYRDVRAGCFQKYVVVPAHTVSHVPKGMTMASAACLGVPALTAAMTLWKWLNVPLPSESSGQVEQLKDEWLLIWGGSTSTGQFATQFAAISGLKVITVNSQSTKALSEKLGATHVVVRDGKSDSELVEEIRLVTNGDITRAIDLVSSKTAAISLQAVSQESPVHFAPLALMSSSQVVPGNVSAHTVEMKQYVLDSTNKGYADELNKIMSEGKIEMPEILHIEGGLEAVPAGLDILKKGNMGGKKLVAKIY
ncbi:hypothetical protein N7495_002455 [Penicillium taxi]|uniref:uncharacterized protein n=1 Tax=Penicillium taxi TaxID=168475 RepID=UPI002544D356|nr:uncharacterized protein N7495_002455 [Penicillium taxi]KAJ5901927.1 hypothetical protein N7495_002455 [Penicillium taxi]